MELVQIFLFIQIILRVKQLNLKTLKKTLWNISTKASGPPFNVNESDEETKEIHDINDTKFYNKTKRIALHNCGVIDPENINEYSR